MTGAEFKNLLSEKELDSPSLEVDHVRVAMSRIEMPELSGSEKQIKWANNLREKAIWKELDVIFGNWGILRTASWSDRKAKKLEQAADKVSTMLKEKSASWWISNYS